MSLPRLLWVDAGQEPNFAKAKREVMSGMLLPISDPMDDLQRRVAAIRGNNFVAGVYMAHNDGWPQFWGVDGQTIAERMHILVGQIGGKLKVQFDYEQHTPSDYQTILAMLTRWRQLRPTMDTSWTMEGHQGQTMTAAFVASVVKMKIRVVPQCYDAPMEHVWDTLEMTRDLTKRGFPDALISPFHDAAKLPQWWTGYAFIQNRLPS